MTTATAPPRPTGVYAAFYPTSIVLPDKTTVWHRCKAYVTPEGLFVYRAAPTSHAEPEAAYWAPINFAGTGRPRGDIRMGWPVSLADGTMVTLTDGGGCGCGNPLKGWHPSWAGSLLEWPV